MSRRSQFGSLAILFGLIVFGFIWITGLAPMISDIGTTSVQSGGLTGLNAFFYSNLNLVIGVAYTLACVITVKVGFL